MVIFPVIVYRLSNSKLMFVAFMTWVMHFYDLLAETLVVYVSSAFLNLSIIREGCAWVRARKKYSSNHGCDIDVMLGRSPKSNETRRLRVNARCVRRATLT